jgi:hypothetical protein
MSDQERDLRDALQARAGQVPVGRADEAGLVRRLAAARRRRQQARMGAAAAALVMVLGAATLVAADDEEPSNLIAGPDPSTTTSLTEVPSTAALSIPVETSLPSASMSSVAPVTSTAPTTVPRTTTTTAPPPPLPPLPPLPEDALWPAPGSTTTFSSPDKAATDFARRYLEMPTPQVAAPNVSGAEATVAVRALPRAGLTTVVSLRRVDVRGWIVVGCAAPSIEVSEPAAGATISSPLTVRGRAQAFEGHVAVEVRRDWATAPIGSSFGTGSMDQLTAYEATVSFTRPTSTRGTVIVYEPRVDDGTGPLAATVVRIRF